MFCPKCGSEVKDGDMFCGECGMRMEPLESENQQTESQKTADQNETQKSRPVQPNQAPNKAPAKSGGLFKGFSSKAKKIVIAEVAVLVVLIAAFFYIGNSKSSPEAAANQIIIIRNGPISMISLICQKIHLSMKKHLKRQWIRMRQRLYQHQLVVM